MIDGVKRGVSVVVPTYGNEQGLEPLVTDILETLQRENRTFEILFVNDGSPDATWDAIQRLHSLHPEVRGINLMRNYGQHNALLAGILNARQDVVVTVDDDGQTPPVEIPKLLNKLDEGYDLVYGARDKEQHGLVRNLASRLTKSLVQYAMRARLARSITSFRAFRTDLLREYPHDGPPSVFIDALLDWNAQKVTSVLVEHRMRGTGKSTFSWTKLVNHAVNMVTGLSVVPLQLAVLLGFLATLFGLCLFVYVFGSYLLQGSKVPGFTFLAIVILLFSGVQLCVLGIIGEYLSRIYLRLLGKPAFVIKEML
jgi:undecaprenyl-phosphate 4-deoxy-4-formamido-L-arabinose transferase